MAFAIITIPFNPATKSFHSDELNRFCLNKKITAKKVEFFKDGEAVYWSVFLEYETLLEETGRETSGLTRAGKLCYEKLRALRKETAEKEGIPPFVIAKNSQFVEIINKELTTLEGLKQINGFGRKKIENTARISPASSPVFFEKKHEVVLKEKNSGRSILGRKNNEGSSAGTSDNSKGSRFGRGKKCHEVTSKKIIHDESHHMPSLTESAG